MEEGPSNGSSQPIFAGLVGVGEIEKMQKVVSKYFGLKTHDLNAATRVKEVAIPRQIAIYLIRK